MQASYMLCFHFLIKLEFIKAVNVFLACRFDVFAEKTGYTCSFAHSKNAVSLCRCPHKRDKQEKIHTVCVMQAFLASRVARKHVSKTYHTCYEDIFRWQNKHKNIALLYLLYLGCAMNLQDINLLWQLGQNASNVTLQ